MVDNGYDDEALARLRASDPATGSHPDLHSLRALIGAKAPASQGSDRATAVTDDAFRGPRLRAPWIAAAAVAALGIGAGGYALGTQNAGPAPTAGQQIGGPSQAGAGRAETQPAGPGEVMMGGVDMAEQTQSAIAQGGGMASSSSAAMFDAGPVRLTAGPDLSTEGGTAEVKAITSNRDASTFVNDWSAQLDFDGVHLPEDQQWFGPNAIVDPTDLRVVTASDEASGPMAFGFEDLLGNPDCASMYDGASQADLDAVKTEWQRAIGADVPFPDSSMCKDSSGSRPSDEQAISAAEDFLASTGLDFSAYTFSVEDWMGPESTSPTVYVVGVPEDQATDQLRVSVNVGPQGVFSANGNYGELTSLGDYPVISPVEAVQRYGQREFSMDYGVMLAEDVNASYSDEVYASGEPTMPEPAQVTPGMKIPLLLKDKTVVSAELSHGTIWTQTGGTLDVPTWKLVTEDGMHYAVLAVADEAIDWQSWE
ncbi:hypothetical protein ACQBAT_12120 [Ornithinimicrobium sp. Y1847]|uniref:hypothetical protein n=1 Tax=Ornithinimicrobium sp. Y1847 TaxID=3405419 RepID=UPI003B66FCAB